MMTALPKQADTNYLQEVREHYENYPYPPTDPQDERSRVIITVMEALDRLNYRCFSGRRDFRKEFRSLVAGGGTGDAVIALAEQLRDTGNEVVYIDMSEASMKVAQQRAEIRGLSNIRWIRDSLLNIPQMGLGQFDYINCSGVLHHLADPDAGLKVLSDALKDDGAMGIMVYAQYGRMAVYMMQSLLRGLNENEPNLQLRVENAKAVLTNMPASNWFLNSSDMIRNEVNGGDIAIYDLLLHSQDRAYTIPQLYAFLGQQGLSPVELFSDYRDYGHNLYNPAYYIRDEALRATFGQWPLQEQQTLAELLHGKIEKHTFYAMKRPAPLPAPTDPEMVPFLGFDIYSEHASILEALKGAQETVSIHQPGEGTVVQLHKTPHLVDIFSYIDGKRPLGEIIKCVQATAGDNPSSEALLEEFVQFFGPMNDALWLFLRHQSTAEVLHNDLFQTRIPA